MKNNIKLFLSLFSLVNIFFIPEWANILGEHSDEQFFLSPTPFHNAYFAFGLTVLGIAFLLFLLIGITQKFEAKKLESLFCLSLLACLIVPLNFLREYAAVFNHYPFLSDFSHQFIAKVLGPFKFPVIALVSVMGYQLVKRQSEKITRATYFLGLVLIPAILVTYSNLVSVYHQNGQHQKKLASYSGSEAKKNKILWIIFDELDYRLVFEKRPASLQLPELDRLKQEALFAENAYPPSDYTVHSIPSLLSGERVDVSKVEAGDLILWEPHKNTKEPWTQAPSVFKEAKKLGRSIALVGWYHSYCKIFFDDVDYCRRFPAGRFGYAKFFGNSIKAILERSFILDKRRERAFIFNLSQTQKEALRILDSDQFDFIFLHYSVPHKPYLFERSNKTISPQVERTPENYFGNLEVVDHLLGEIRQKLEVGNQWNDSVVIVSSDHSWRKSEEYDGIRDVRVPFIVKMPDNLGLKIKNSIPSLLSKDFILSVMKNEIKNTVEAKSWLIENSKSFPDGTVLVPIDQENKIPTGNKNKVTVGLKG